MLYYLEQGPVEATILKQCAQQNLPIPEKIANAPELELGLELYYIAFLDLTTCRGSGYDTEGPISWLAILQWVKEHGIEGEQREDLFYFIQVLDKAYLDFKTKKLKRTLGQPTKLTGKKGKKK